MITKDVVKTNLVEKAMLDSGLLVRDNSNNPNKGSDFKYVLPKELVFVMHIHPKAFAHYLPVWIKEEFAKRTEYEMILTSFGFECVCDSFINGESEITYSIWGKAREVLVKDKE
jgi:hypothetical protein